MAKVHFPPFIMFFIFFFSSANAFFSSSPASTSLVSICDNTPFPYFCKFMLPHNNSATIHDYGRLSLNHSLKMSNHLLSLVNHYLSHRRYALPKSYISALEDCQILFNLNMEFISNTIQSIRSTDTLQRLPAEDMQTLLSAILTNQETCSESLQAVAGGTGGSRKGSILINRLLSSLMSNGTKSFSVSLALFMHGWGHSAIKGRSLSERSSFSGIRKLVEKRLLQTSEYSQIVVVNLDGSGNFTTINDAVGAAPNNSASNSYFVIHVMAGVYEEYVSIPTNKRNIMMIGDGINKTIITGNRSVVDGWTTYNCATFAVTGPGFVAVNITFRNTAGAIKRQAVAVRNGADLSTFYRCSFEGYQDTLYTHSLRQFYRECDVYGTVDFIFGNAAVVFQNCNIYLRLPLSYQFNVITAQGRTDINQNTGTSIHKCNIRAAQDLALSNGPSIKTFLGRPWKEYSRVVCMQSFMDELIDPAGWSLWAGDFALSTLYYAEYNNTGPGSVTAKRVTWPGYKAINASDALNFTVSSFIQGDFWLPASRVPFTFGLL